MARNSQRYNRRLGLAADCMPPDHGFLLRSLLSLNLHHDQDVVTARQRAAQIARLLEFDTSEQTRLATAVSEIVRNAFRYADMVRSNSNWTRMRARSAWSSGLKIRAREFPGSKM